MGMFDQIRSKLQYSDMLIRLIIINVAIFIIVNLAFTFLRLFTIDTVWLEVLSNKLAVPAWPGTLLTQPWSVITYQFMHHNLFHILFNMLWLYWMGRIFVEFLSSRRLLGVYITGGIAGAALYILFYNVFPLFSGVVEQSFAIGASASVLAITIAVATLVPDYTIFLVFFGAVKVKYIALVTILIDLISISGSNAGGHIAHLGGAAFGFLFIRQLRNGRDLVAWVGSVGDWLTGRFRPQPKAGAKMKVTWRKEKQPRGSEPDQETVDRILDKIGKSGYASLTSEEKEILFRVSNRKK